MVHLERAAAEEPRAGRGSWCNGRAKGVHTENSGERRAERLCHDNCVTCRRAAVAQLERASELGAAHDLGRQTLGISREPVEQVVGWASAVLDELR